MASMRSAPESAPVNTSSTMHSYHGPLSKSYSTPVGENEVHPLATSRRQRTDRQLTRAQSIREALSTHTATFFGVPAKQTSRTSAVSAERLYKDKKWAARRMRHCSRMYGAVKEPPPEQQLHADDVTVTDAIVGQLPTPPSAVTDPSLPRIQTQQSVESQLSVMTVGRSISGDSRASKIRVLERRESVAKMAWSGLSTLIVRGTLKPKKTVPASSRRQRYQSRSFTPGSVATDDNSVFEYGAVTPDVSPGTAGTLPESIPMATIREVPSRQHSIDVEAIELDGDDDRDAPTPLVEELLARDETDERGLRRTYALPPETPSSAGTSLHDDVFFDISPSGAASASAFQYRPQIMPPQEQTYKLPKHGHRYNQQTQPVRIAGARDRPYEYPPVFMKQKSVPVSVEEDQLRRRVRGEEMVRRQIGGGDQMAGIYRSRVEPPDRPPLPAEIKQPVAKRRGLRRLIKQPAVEKEPQEPLSLSNFWSRVVSRALSNSDRRKVGEGVVGRWFGRRLKKRSELSARVRQQIDDFDDYRPYFTYYVTTVQILVAIISVCLYGFGPFGFTRQERTANVLHSTVTLKQVVYWEQQSFWLGPSYSDLVHLGAKYSPCMRHDENIYKKIAIDRNSENDTACCIYNDKIGCFQASKIECPSLIAKHLKWSVDKPGYGGRTVGSVCGQDPRACLKPPSVSPFEWENDLTKWPICEKFPSIIPPLENLQCEITGRPCCVGVHGQCRITTREYCDFVKGYFHEEATLCSQVSCLGEVCGMIPFLHKDYPNQFYRLFISLFLHAGLLHCLLTVLLQYFLMTDLEKLVGWHRLAIVYIFSGIGGNLASATFLPYRAEVGPSGSQFGLVAALFVDAFYSWQMIQRPWKAVLQLLVVASVLFLLGFLPWVDNWANSFGFLFGLMLSLALFPYIQFNQHDRLKRIIIVVVSLFVAIGLLATFIILFYVTPIWTCTVCKYFTCIPFTDRFCDNQGIELDLLPI